MSRERHPDTETLASLRAGLAGRFRGRRLAAHVARCPRCAATCDELGAVDSFLASVPVPSLPESFERQITAALAAEAATRAATAREGAGAAAGNGSPVLSPAPRRRVRADRFRPAMAFAPVLACLLLAGFGYLLSNTGGGSSAGPPVNGLMLPASANAPSVTTSPSAPSASLQHPLNPGTNARTAGTGTGRFLVVASGTQYQAATLRTQVSAELDSLGIHPGTTESGSALSSSTSSDNGGGFFPSSALTDCVLHLTNQVTPSLVDQASYQAEPVYVIALPDRVWVVGRGCTAGNPELVVTVTLTAPLAVSSGISAP
jgi:hypothetical protein